MGRSGFIGLRTPKVDPSKLSLMKMYPIDKICMRLPWDRITGFVAGKNPLVLLVQNSGAGQGK